MRVCRHQTVLCVLTVAVSGISSGWLGATESTAIAPTPAKPVPAATGQTAQGKTSSESGQVLGSAEVRRLLVHAWDALDRGDIPMAHTLAEAALERSISARQFGQQPARVLRFIESRRLRGEALTRPASMTRGRMAEIDPSAAKPAGKGTGEPSHAAPTPKSPIQATTTPDTRPGQTRVSETAKRPEPVNNATVVRQLLSRTRAELDAGNIAMAHTIAEAAAGTVIPFEKFKAAPDRVLREIETVRLPAPQSKSSVSLVARTRPPSPAKTASTRTVKKPSRPDATGRLLPSPRTAESARARKKPAQRSVAITQPRPTPDSPSTRAPQKAPQPDVSGQRLPSPVKISATPPFKQPPSSAVAIRRLPPPIDPESIPAIKPPSQPATEAMWLPSAVKISSTPVREESIRPAVTGVLGTKPAESGSKTALQGPTQPAVIQHVASPIGALNDTSESPTRVVKTKKDPSFLAPGSEWAAVPTNVAKSPDAVPSVAADMKSEVSPTQVVASGDADADAAWSQFRIVLPSSGRSPHWNRPTQSEVAAKLEPAGSAKLVAAASPRSKPPILPVLPVIQVSFDEESLPTADAKSVKTPVSPTQVVASGDADADAAWSQFRIVLPSSGRSPHWNRPTQSEVAAKLEPAGSAKLVAAASSRSKPPILPVLPVIQVSFDEESLPTADAKSVKTPVSPAIAIQCDGSGTGLELHFSALSNIDVMAAVRIPTVTVEDPLDNETKTVVLKTPANRARTYNKCPEVRNLEAIEWYDFRPSRNTYAFHHYPLYFEDPNLERCGKSRGLLTNVSSAALTLAQLPALPYMMTVQPPKECVRAKADCPTCHEFDLDAYLPEFSLPASAIEAAAVVAFVFLVP